MELRASGGVQLMIDQMDVDRLSLLIGGQPETTLRGVVSSINADLAGTARFDAEKLRSQRAVVRAKGESWSSVWVTAHLKQDVAATSELKVVGDPELTKR